MNCKRFKILTISFLFLASSLYAGLPSFFPFSGTKTFSLNGIYAAGSEGISNLTTNPAGIAFLKGRSFEISIFDRLGQQDLLVAQTSPLKNIFRTIVMVIVAVVAGVVQLVRDSLLTRVIKAPRGRGSLYHPADRSACPAA